MENQDVENDNFGIYFDTWDYEVREVNENVYIFNKNTGERLYR